MSSAESAVRIPVVGRVPGLVDQRRLPIIRNGAAVFAATLVWHGSNFAFNSVAARLLGPNGYSELAAAVTLLYIGSPLLVSIQTTTSRTVTSLSTRGDTVGIARLLTRLRTRLLLVGAAAVAAGVLFAGLFAHALHLSSGGAVAIVVAGLSISLLTHCQRGFLQGQERFGAYAASTASEAITKVGAAAAILVLLRRDVDGAVAAIPLAAACTLVLNSWLLRGTAAERGETAAHPRARRERPLPTLATFGLLAVLLSADVLAAKRFLPSHEAGLYAAVSLCGKTTFFATSFLAVFMFPVLSARHERGTDARRVLGSALAAVVCCSLLMSAIYASAPGVVVGPLFGPGFAGARPYVGWIGVAFGGYAVVYLCATSLLAQRRSIGAAILAGIAVLQVAGLAIVHGSIGAIVDVQLVVCWTGAALLATAAFMRREPGG
jgi:O-antigen/teichoic acid export membrane protein